MRIIFSWQIYRTHVVTFKLIFFQSGRTDALGAVALLILFFNFMAIDHHHVLPKDYLARERLETSLLFPPDLFADFFFNPISFFSFLNLCCPKLSVLGLT